VLLDLVLLDLLLQRNLPFDLITSKEWQKYTKLLNPVVTMPGRWKMRNLVATEYARAFSFVKKKLATARGIIHLSFDGWTSRQNASFLGINAHFIDEDWNP
jgi:hypothetical protein